MRKSLTAIFGAVVLSIALCGCVFAPGGHGGGHGGGYHWHH